MTLQVIPAFQRLTYDVLWHLFGYICLNDPLKGPMLISHISQWWRLVALDFPSIWCNITMRLCTSSQKHLLASAYIERSGNVPISLIIHGIRRFQPWEKIKLLLPHAHRIRSLHVRTSAGSLANLLWLDLNMPMPRLEAFDSVISNTSHISIRKIATIGGKVNTIPLVSARNLVCWDSWSPTGLTALTLDTTCLVNKPNLDDIYNALASTCHTIQYFEYQGFIACIDAGVNVRTRLVFPVLRSLTVLSHDDMVPLLRLMIVPALESLILRDFVVCPNIPTIPASELMDIDELTPGLTFDPDGLFRVIKEWKSITNLEIFGIEDVPSDDLFSPPDLLDYIKSLNRLSSLVLYGIGAGTSIANILFVHDPPLLPQLSHFLLAIDNIAPNDDLSHYLTARQRHNLPRLKKLSVNSQYIQHLIELNRINILWESSDDIFVIADPEAFKHIPVSEVTLPRA